MDVAESTGKALNQRVHCVMLQETLKSHKIAALWRFLATAMCLAVMELFFPALGGQLLSNKVPAAAREGRSIGRLDSSKRLNLAIGLPLRNQAALNSLLHDLYDPASPRFHCYLTPSEFAQRFGPATNDYEKLKKFAQARGLLITGMHPNRTLLDVTGAVADIERTFHVRMRTYQHPTENRTFFSADTDPWLDIDVPLLAVDGLDNYVLPHPMNLQAAGFGAATYVTGAGSGSGPGRNYIGNDFRTAYAPGVPLNGAGQSVGLLELDEYYPADIASYEALAGLPNVLLTNVVLDGLTGPPGYANIEVALDIDMAICMAPGLASVIVYEGAIPNDVLNRMATDNQAKQLSSSWGFGATVDLVRDQIYQQFAAQGQSMFQASGDSGAYVNSITAPSDSPYITIVGGTSMQTSGPGGAWLSESAWSGSGGGVSGYFPIPVWQQGVSMAANHGSTNFRNIPDVSCQADIAIWLIADNGHQGTVGGSSASAPLWAGFTALINQQAAANARPGIGFLNPAIYALGQGGGYASALHDITAGNNTNSSSPSNYFAVPGYDLVTGWGSPNGSNLINALSPEPFQITPAAGFLATGPFAGPFNLASETFVLTNIGAGPLGWTGGTSAAWLGLSFGSGILSPGGPATSVTASLNNTASNLAAGSYTATVWFTNLNDRSIQTRQVTLDIVTVPAINQQPVNENVPAGGTAVFTVGTTSNALEYFQWQQGGTNLTDAGNISGSLTSALTITNVNGLDAANYQVIVSNAAGSVTSMPASLNIVSSAPVILAQPQNQTAPQGASVLVTVTAAGNAPLNYQWQCNSINLADGGNIAGSSSSALTLSSFSAALAGTYSVLISNAIGITPSAPASVALVPLTASGVTLTTLYTFTNGTDGANPNGLMQETNGNFYGTTQSGGATAGGTIFQMTPSGSLTTLSTFSTSGGGGYNPTAALVQGPDGNLYGTAEYGAGSGGGTLYRITTNGVRTRLEVFMGTNGFAPYRTLTVATDGAIYGTTVAGGGLGAGAVFRITTGGAFTLLAAFNGANGFNPNELTQAASGVFYGTTFDGGASGDGTLFYVTTNGMLGTVATFSYTSGGYLPYAGLVPTPQGNFIGAGYEGGASNNGALFQVTPTGTVTTLYSFTGGNDGGHPGATLVAGSDGNYYGTTVFGGAYGDGTLFRLSPGGALITLAQLDGYDGANPQAPLIFGSDGNLYGSTQDGGASNAGVLFRVNINSPGLQISGQPANQIVFSGQNAVFSVAVAGNGPLGYQWRENGTNLTDGPNISGSTNRVLTLINATPANSGVYSVLVTNPGNSVLSQGATLSVDVSPPQITTQPASQILSVGATAIFTVTAIGDVPLSYQWQENGTNLSDGGQITGSSTSSLSIAGLFETNSGTYSVIVTNAIASTLSANATLTVNAVSSSGTAVSAAHAFTGGADGGVPNALVAGANGLLYGTTQTGGAYGYGTVFSFSTNGALTTLTSFGGTNGAMPAASLTQASNGLFYGTTLLGGSNSAGTIFSVSSNGALVSLFSFGGGIDSVDPFTSLTADAGGNLYGMASNNSVFDDGNCFVLTTNGMISNFYIFPGGINGTWPAAALALGPDGNFYGMTTNGGSYTNGNIFRMTPSGGVTNIYSFTGGQDGYAPAGQLALGSDGNFYGVTSFDTIQGNLFYGTVFKVTPNGALTTLYKLDGVVNFTDGVKPVAGLCQGADGNFYGTTYIGYYIDLNGTIHDSSHGTVFTITPGGAFTTLTAFNGGDDGSNPETALVQGPDGAFYGTTSTGGPGGQGTIYRIAFTNAPSIATQPVSQTNTPGSSVTFSATVYGAAPLSWQWLRNGENLIDGGDILGSSARVLTVKNISAADAGSYYVIVNNSVGSAQSSVATLALEQAPTFQSATASAGNFIFTWSAMLGRNYQLQSTTNLTGAWTNYGAPVNATNSVMSASGSLVPFGGRFYRVLLLP